MIQQAQADLIINGAILISSVQDRDKNQSLGLNASLSGAGDNNAETNPNSSVGVEYSNERQNSKTKILSTIGTGNLQISDTDNSNTRMLNRDIQNREISIYDIESNQGLSGSLDTRLLTEQGRDQIGQELREFGQNVQIIANSVPAAQGGNVIENAVGAALNTLSDETFGIIPSDKSNGGIIAQIPILLGDRDIYAGVYQVRASDDPIVQNNPDYMPAEQLSFYDALPAESKAQLEGSMVTVQMVDYASKMATTQIFGSGQSNTLPQAIVNGMEQTGADTLNIMYNPSRGGLSDTLESFVDKTLPILTTGMATVYGEEVSNMIQTNQQAGINTNIANHSQANILFVVGVDHVGGNIGLPPQEGGGESTEDNQRDGTYKPVTVNAYGSPVGSADLLEATQNAGVAFSGSHANEGDGVATVLGGNAPGTNELATMPERLQALPSLVHNITGSKYGDNPSGHSTYTCQANCGNDGNLTPEQLEAQRRGEL